MGDMSRTMTRTYLRMAIMVRDTFSWRSRRGSRMWEATHCRVVSGNTWGNRQIKRENFNQRQFRWTGNGKFYKIPILVSLWLHLRKLNVNKSPTLKHCYCHSFLFLTWCLFRGAIKKKNYQTLDIVQTPAAPPPPLGRYGRIKFGRSDLTRTPLPLP